MTRVGPNEPQIQRVQSSTQTPTTTPVDAGPEPETTSDGFTRRTEGDAPTLSSTPVSNDTPEELRQAMLAERLRHTPGRAGQPRRQPRAQGTPPRPPGDLAPMSMGGMGGLGGAGGPMGMGVAGNSPDQVREQLQASEAFGRLTPAEQGSLLSRLDAEGVAGQVAAGQIGGVMSNRAWGGATVERRAEALRRTADLPLPDPRTGRVPPPPPGRSAAEIRADLQGSEAFAALGPVEQEDMLARLDAPGRRGEIARQEVDQALSRPDWVLQDAAGQASALRSAAHNADFKARQAEPEVLAAQVTASPGFGALDSSTQEGLQTRLANPNERALRQQLDRVVGTPEFGRADAAAQAAALEQVLGETPVAPTPEQLEAAGPMRGPRGAGGKGGAGSTGAPALDPAPSRPAVEARLEGSGALQHLGADEREALQTRLTATGPAGEAMRRALDRELDHPTFGLRSEAERAQSLRGFLRNTENWPLEGEPEIGADHYIAGPEQLPSDAVAQVEALPGFDELTADEQARLQAVLGGERNPLSRGARSAASDLAFRLELVPADRQADRLRHFLREGAFVPGNADWVDVEQTAQHETSIGRPRRVAGHAFRGVEADALLQTVRIGDHRVQVVSPAQPPELEGEAPHLATVEEVTAALAHLSPEALHRVHRVTINPTRNPGDGYWAAQMDRPGFRAAATAGRGGDMHLYPSASEVDVEDLGDVMRHEAGHFNSHDTLYPSSESFWPSFTPDWDDWQAAARNDRTTVSTYGAENQDEDYAEAYALYMGTRGTALHDEYRAIFPNRFALLDRLVD